MHTRSLPNYISQEFYTVKKKRLLPSSLLPLYVQRLFLVFFLSYLWIFIQFWSKAVLSHVLGKKGHALLISLLQSDKFENMITLLPPKSPISLARKY